MPRAHVKSDSAPQSGTLTDLAAELAQCRVSDATAQRLNFASLAARTPGYASIGLAVMNVVDVCAFTVLSTTGANGRSDGAPSDTYV